MVSTSDHKSPKIKPEGCHFRPVGLKVKFRKLSERLELRPRRLQLQMTKDSKEAKGVTQNRVLGWLGVVGALSHPAAARRAPRAFCFVLCTLCLCSLCSLCSVLRAPCSVLCALRAPYSAPPALLLCAPCCVLCSCILGSAFCTLRSCPLRSAVPQACAPCSVCARCSLPCLVCL